MNTSDDRLARWDRPAAVLLLGLPLLVILASTFVSNGATRIYTWPWAFYVQASLLAPWLWCAWSVARGHAGLRAGWWIALPPLAALLPAIGTSAHPHDALEASLTSATPLLLVPFVARAWADATPAQRLLALRVAGAVFAALAATSLVQCLSRAPDSGLVAWFFKQRNPFPLGHWNYTGGLALLGLPLHVLLAWRERGALRAAWVGAAFLTLAQFLSAGSRGAVLGLLLALLAAGALLAARRRASGRALAAGLAALVAIAAIAVATNPRLRRLAVDPAAALSLGASEQQRLGFILTGLRIGAAHPWTGIGPGTTPYHYPEHRVDLPGSLENSFQLHCGPLQWWVDTGTLGLLALAFAGGFLKWTVWRERRRLTPEAVAAAALLAGYGGLWLTDHQLDTPVYPLTLALAAAVLLAEITPERAGCGRAARIVAALLGTAPVALALMLVPAWRARADFAAAWEAKDLGNAHDFIGRLRSAAQAASWHPVLQNHLARALAGIANHLPPETATALRADARQAWTGSIELAPAQDHPWLNLAWLDLAAGRLDEAGASLARAAAIQPRRRGLWYATALVRIGGGDRDGACIALAREARIDPSFLTSPVWREEPFAALRAPVVQLLAGGWAAGGGDPGAPGDAAIAAFARWWWTGKVAPEPAGAPAASPTLRFLDTLASADDRAAADAGGGLPPALRALRAAWRSEGAPATGVSQELIAAWTAHIAAHPGEPFSRLLTTFAATTPRQVVRNADGILFRQTDGDPLTDLTDIPASALLPALEPVLPRPAVDEFLDERWARR